jgi:hypothetical protein
VLRHAGQHRLVGSAEIAVIVTQVSRQSTQQAQRSKLDGSCIDRPQPNALPDSGERSRALDRVGPWSCTMVAACLPDRLHLDEAPLRARELPGADPVAMMGFNLDSSDPSQLFDRRHSPVSRATCFVVSHPKPPLIPISFFSISYLSIYPTQHTRLLAIPYRQVVG